tara:strand:+ start:339 stop:554 length:216 start_codon:yes stop_codon:yes gene_type:complete
MYTDQDYQSEKNMMSKQERMVQDRFEQMINILIFYKQENKDLDVYLSEKCVNDAVNFYQKKMSPILNNLNN